MSATDKFAGFRAALRNAVKRTETCLCVGIDPERERMPEALRTVWAEKGEQYALEVYSDILIEAAAGNVPAVKLQSAFYEAYGPAGFQALKNSLAKARANGLITILDAKRGDIASTMKAYGVMAFDEMRADALTVTPYMGFDVIEPLLPWLKAGKGVYVVWVSSNPEGAFLQDMTAQHGGKDASVATHMREYLVERFHAHGVDDALGLVLGATKLHGMSDAEVRALSSYPLLMPGVGAQGGEISGPVERIVKDVAISLVPQSRALSAVLGLEPRETAALTVDGFRQIVAKRVREAKAELAV